VDPSGGGRVDLGADVSQHLAELLRSKAGRTDHRLALDLNQDQENNNVD